MRRLAKMLANLSGFGIAPLLVSVASIASVPILLTTVGESAWLSIAIGQAMGDLARSVTLWGWNSVGLTTIARLDRAQRVQYYLDSIPPRLMLLVPVTLILFILSFVWPVEDPLAMFVMAMAGAIFGLNGTWIFIGSREPRNLIIFNAVPRSLSIIAGSLITFIIPSSVLFGLFSIAGNIVAAVAPTMLLMRRAKRMNLVITWPSVRDSIQAILNGFAGFSVGFVMAARMSVPVIVTPLVAPAAGPTIALAEKFIRWSNTGMTPLIQYIQTGIPRGSRSLSSRILRGTTVTWMLALLTGTTVALLVPFGSEVMSNSTIHLDWRVGCLIGIVIAMIFVSSVTGNASLVLLGRIGAVARCALIGLAILVSLTVLLANTFQTNGTMIAFAAAEVFIALYLTIMLFRELRTGKYN